MSNKQASARKSISNHSPYETHPAKGAMVMRILLVAVLLGGGLLLAQDNAGKTGSAKDSRGQVTVTGCVSIANGDYILMKQDLSYQLQPPRKMRLKNYLGHRVEITGTTSPTLSTSSDAINKVGSASSLTLNIRSIKILNSECSERAVAK
jgi:hypothetical protein